MVGRKEIQEQANGEKKLDGESVHGYKEVIAPKKAEVDGQPDLPSTSPKQSNPYSKQESQSTDMGTSDDIKLLPLIPEFEPESHQIYVDVLRDSLRNERVLNIALSGHYGVGKSSILRKLSEVESAQKPITISLSSFRTSYEDQADTSTQKQGASYPQDRKKEDQIANELQKEIVKQIVYRLHPSKTPNSRFRRIAEPTLRSFWLPVAVITLFLFIALYLTGYGTTLLPYGHLNEWSQVGVYLLFFSCSYILLLYLHYRFFNRIRIDKVTTGSTVLSLTEQNQTYFDKFLDEIVYYFEISKTKLVIFEDLDRFNNPIIFENLHSLNAILNNSSQLLDKRIRFIYAIRDSIFELQGSESVDCMEARSIRTKFFDVIISVVPFITHTNSQDMMTSVMSGLNCEISKELMKIAAKHVTDMRVLKNVRNEFQLFRKCIIRDTSIEKKLELSLDNLYALILYKNTHIGDFEKISKGNSQLDDIYKYSRAFVNKEIDRLTGLVSKLRIDLEQFSTTDLRCEHLGRRLEEYVSLYIGSNGSSSRLSKFRFDLGNEEIRNEDLYSVELWKKIISGHIPLKLTYESANHSEFTVELSLEKLEKITKERLSIDLWFEEDHSAIANEIEANTQLIDVYRKASIADLIRMNPVIGKNESGSQVSFKAYVDDQLQSQLARELVASGYIDKYFALYSAVFHGLRVSIVAQNFIIKCIGTHSMDPEFVLKSEDVIGILKEVVSGDLSYPGAYNINLLDYLLETEDEKKDELLSALATLDADAMLFLDIYWRRGKHCLALSEQLVTRSREFLNYIAGNKSISSEKRVELTDVALANLEPTLYYTISKELALFLAENIHGFSVISGDPCEKTNYELLSNILRRCNVVVNDLTKVNRSVLSYLIENNGYEINRSNVLLAMSPIVDLSLNGLFRSCPKVYRYIIGSIPAYLDMLGEIEYSLSGDVEDDMGIVILNDVFRYAAEQVGLVIKKAEPKVSFSRIEAVNKNIWQLLAKEHRITLTWENVWLYITQFGLDAEICGILVSVGHFVERSVELSQDQEEAVCKMGQRILEARDDIDSLDVRVNLVRSLDVGPIFELPDRIKEDRLVGKMIACDLIEDSMETFADLNSIEARWSVVEYAISKSKAYCSFVSPQVLSSSQAGMLLESRIISEEVKKHVVERCDELIDELDIESQKILARVARKIDIRLTLPDIETAAEAKADPDDLVFHLAAHLRKLPFVQLTHILRSIGGEYAHLAFKSGMRPTFSNNAHNLALLEKLQDHDVVSSIKVEGSKIRAIMRKS